MGKIATVLLLFAAAVLQGGCNMAMRTKLDNTGRNQVVRVESGQRFYLTLEENDPVGCRWFATCKDPDIRIEVAHETDEEGAAADAPGEANVEIRVHRGYDGPSDVHFEYRRPREKKPLKKFTITLYRRTGDCAAWE